MQCVEVLVKEKLSRTAVNTSWRQLVSHGEEALTRVCALCTDEAWLVGDGARREELKRVVVGLNQSVVRREWVMLLANTARMTASGAAWGEPAIEDGALLLVRLYLTAKQLADGPRAAAATVRAELDAIAERLVVALDAAGQLAVGTRRPVSAVAAVRALSALLFREEGFGGNAEDYYNYRNSLLDHVLASRKGIPISLSVLFASVCRRVDVHLDFIGLPGHFLLATRPEPGHERIFVDAFHGGEILDISQCQDSTRCVPSPTPTPNMLWC